MSLSKSTGRLAVVVLSAVLSAASAAFGNGWSDYPKDEWPTFGGDYAQTRFSQLKQINKGNVKSLELKWVFNTGLDYDDPWYTFSPVPIIVDEVMYLADPGNFFFPFQTAFAVDAESGNLIWSQQLPLGEIPEARGQGNVRATRGVAYGNGRVYVPTQDATIWALDSATGALVGSFGTNGAVVVGDVDAGYYLTSPPIFVPADLVPVPEGDPAWGRRADDDLLVKEREIDAG